MTMPISLPSSSTTGSRLTPLSIIVLRGLGERPLGADRDRRRRHRLADGARLDLRDDVGKRQLEPALEQALPLGLAALLEQDVSLGQDADDVVLGVDDRQARDLLRGQDLRGLLQRRVRPDGQELGGHDV